MLPPVIDDDLTRWVQTWAQCYPSEHDHVLVPLHGARVLDRSQMDVGPLLHADDVMAGKMDALYNRSAARDFLDIDAALRSGRYSLTDLCQLARDADAGFDVGHLAAMLGRVDLFDDDDVTDYGLSPEEVAALRARVHDWRRNLTHPT